MENRKFFKKAFTLVEMLIIVGLIGILSTIVIVPLNNSKMKARDARRITELRQLWLALQVYAENNNGNYPDSLSGLGVTLPKDPATGRDYFYCASGTPGGKNDGGSFHLGAVIERTPDYYLGTDSDVAQDKCEGIAENPSFHGNATDCSGGAACHGGECENCFDLDQTAEIMGNPGPVSSGEGCGENTGSGWANSNGQQPVINGSSMSADGQILAVASSSWTWPGITSGHLYISTDGGKTWQEKAPNIGYGSVSVSPEGNYIAATGSNGKFYVSKDSGSTWEESGVVGMNQYWSTFSMSDDGRYQTAGSRTSKLYVSSDYGKTWEPKGSTANWWNYMAMSFDGKYQTALAYNDKAFYVSDDYGKNWTKGAMSGPWERVAMSDSGQYQTLIGFSSSSNPLYVSSDYGKTWTVKGSSYWRDVAISGDGQHQTAIAFSGMDANRGRIFISDDFGDSWTEKLTADRVFFSSISMSEGGQVQTIATSDGPIYSSNDFGNTWTAKGPNDRWISVAVSADGKSQMAITRDAGATFSKIYLSGCKE